MTTYHCFQCGNQIFSVKDNALGSEQAPPMKYLQTRCWFGLNPVVSGCDLTCCKRSRDGVTAKCPQKPLHEVKQQMLSLNAAFHLVRDACHHKQLDLATNGCRSSENTSGKDQVRPQAAKVLRRNTVMSLQCIEYWRLEHQCPFECREIKIPQKLRAQTCNNHQV